MVEFWWRHPVRFASITAPRGERWDLVMFTKPSCLPMAKVVFVLHSKHHIFPIVLLPLFQGSFFRYSLNVQVLFHVYLDERTAGLFCTKCKKKSRKQQQQKGENWSLLFPWLFGCLFCSVWDYDPTNNSKRFFSATNGNWKWAFYMPGQKSLPDFQTYLLWQRKNT